MAEERVLDDEQISSEEFWARMEAGRFELQRCTACRRLRWPASPLCPECGSWSGEWEAASAHGRVWSLTTYHHAFDRSLADEIPYTVGLVELDAGVRMIGRITGAGIGDEVDLVLPADTERRRLEWRKA